MSNLGKKNADYEDGLQERRRLIIKHLIEVMANHICESFNTLTDRNI